MFKYEMDRELQRLAFRLREQIWKRCRRKYTIRNVMDACLLDRTTAQAISLARETTFEPCLLLELAGMLNAFDTHLHQQE
jgi:hypothetical protein